MMPLSVLLMADPMRVGSRPSESSCRLKTRVNQGNADDGQANTYSYELL